MLQKSKHHLINIYRILQQRKIHILFKNPQNNDQDRLYPRLWNKSQQTGKNWNKAKLFSENNGIQVKISNKKTTEKSPKELC